MNGLFPSPLSAKLCARVLTNAPEQDKVRMKRFVAFLSLEGIPVAEMLQAVPPGVVPGAQRQLSLFSDRQITSVRLACSREAGRKDLTRVPSISCRKFFAKGLSHGRGKVLMFSRSLISKFISHNQTLYYGYLPFPRTFFTVLNSDFFLSSCPVQSSGVKSMQMAVL
jgi:hypothetical protein